MVTTNRIRLTGLLRRSPRLARASLLGVAHPGRARLRRRRAALGPRVARTSLVLVVAALSCSSAAAAPPAPNATIPRDPPALARALEADEQQLAAAIGRWRPKSSAAPADVVLLALYEQRVYRALSANSRLSRAVIRRLPTELAHVATDFVTAHRELYRLTPPIAARTIRVAPAEPAASLLRYYREAQRRFGVPWNVLAAVNFVESKFGKLRSPSAAGAQGPMQFMPATWRQYGLGGNIDNAHDAILGAANYLRASGARDNLRRALSHYNPAGVYGDAVLRYARRIGSDRTTFFSLYSWQVFVKTPRGDRRVTGPGAP